MTKEEIAAFLQSFDQNTADRRYKLYPIKYHSIWEYYVQSEQSRWSFGELDFGDDVLHLRQGLATADEIKALLNILAFFASSDTYVLDNISNNLQSRLSHIPEVQMAYAAIGFEETIHIQTYNELIQLFTGHDSELCDELFDALDKNGEIKNKYKWFSELVGSDDLCKIIVGQAITEGIFFSSSFAYIFYMRKKGLFPGLCSSNEFISRDEGRHCKFACLLYALMGRPLKKEDVATLIKGGVEMEVEFVKKTLPLDCKILGMSQDSMIQYVQFVADVLAVGLGNDKIFNVGNPFDFMESISLEGKTNFFEKRVSEYRLLESDAMKTFILDADF